MADRGQAHSNADGKTATAMASRTAVNGHAIGRPERTYAGMMSCAASASAPAMAMTRQSDRAWLIRATAVVTRAVREDCQALAVTSALAAASRHSRLSERTRDSDG